MQNLAFVDKIERDAGATRVRLELIDSETMDAIVQSPSSAAELLPALEAAETLVLTAEGPDAKTELDFRFRGRLAVA